VLRSAESLGEAAAVLARLGEAGALAGRGTEAWELANLVTVASVLVAAAYARQETRGSHWREDWPETSEQWRGHLVAAMSPDGSFSLAWERT
jgi:L-aspartate oxidase